MSSEATEIICADAAVTVQAAKSKQPTVSIVAYTGGVMSPQGWPNTVIDLRGMQLFASIPLLVDHEAKISGVIGRGVPTIEAGTLYVGGPLLTATKAGAEIVSLARSGFEFQASVGIRIQEFKHVTPGKSVRVNGQTIKAGRAPLNVITKSVLREVSIVPCGADENTSVTIAASARRGLSMLNKMFRQHDTTDHAADDPQQPGSVTAGGDDLATMRANRADELDRQNAIVQACSKFGNPSIVVNDQNVDLAAHAIREGWDASKAELEALRADRPQVGPAIHASGRVAGTREHLEAAMLVRAGLSSVAEEELGANVLEASRPLHSASMVDLCAASLQYAGITPPASRTDMIRAAVSGGDMPLALGNAAGKSVLHTFNRAPATWRAFCGKKSAPNFKEQTAIRPNFLGELEEIGADGEIKHGTFSESFIKWSITTFAKQFKYTRKDFINDDLSLLSETGPALGKMALRKLSDLVYQTLLASGSHFATGNNNYFAGATSALDYASLGKALQYMRTQRDENGADLDITPVTLVVGPSNETTARELINSEFLERDANSPTGNAHRGQLKLEVEPRLENTERFTGASALAWYLFAAPIDLPMLVGFLDGKEGPNVEFFGLDHDIDMLALGWRCYADFGAAMGDHRSAVKAKGET